MVFSTATIAIIGFFLFWSIYIFSESKLNVLFVTLNVFGDEMGSFPDDCLHFMSLLEERRKKELMIFFISDRCCKVAAFEPSSLCSSLVRQENQSFISMSAWLEFIYQRLISLNKQVTKHLTLVTHTLQLLRLPMSVKNFKLFSLT